MTPLLEVSDLNIFFPARRQRATRAGRRRQLHRRRPESWSRWSANRDAARRSRGWRLPRLLPRGAELGASGPRSGSTAPT